VRECRHRTYGSDDVTPHRLAPVAAALGYGLGTVQGARVAQRLAARPGVDAGRDGTGNPGALNTAHLLGRKWGAAVFAFDAAKAYAAARLGRRLGGDHAAHLAATAAVIGHCHPPRGAGGKGVAASLGQVAGTFPVYLPVDMAVGAAVGAVPGVPQPTRTSTTVASITWIVATVVWWRRALPNPGGARPDGVMTVAALMTSLVIAERFAAEADRVAAFNRAETESIGGSETAP